MKYRLTETHDVGMVNRRMLARFLNIEDNRKQLLSPMKIAKLR